MASIWTGALTFGLVNIPVSLASAVRAAEKTSFRMLHKEDLTPIKYERVCPRDEEVVPWNEIVKGYEYSKGKYVVVTSEELAKVKTPSSRAVEMMDFVKSDEIDPREELVNKILEYKRFKEASAQMAEMEALRMLMVKRGNIQKELSGIGEEAGEGTEIQNITLFKLMKAFERAMQKYSDRVNKPVHTVVQYRYNMETSRENMLDLAQTAKTLAFEKIFERAENRVHAIFLFLSLLELVQQKFLKIMIGEGKNNFIIEYNEPENRLVELEEDNQQPQ